MTIKDNLRLVKEDLTDEEMIEACKLACLDEFINVLPDKYDTMIGEGGLTLSGGQRQRLAIARALVQKTEIILFDEATSALDNTTEVLIQQALDELCKGRTTIVVAHRLSTVKNAHQIAVVDNGQIVEKGTHDELLALDKEYARLYNLQFKSQE